MKKYGYNFFDEYFHWRSFKKYAGGPMCDLGSHQVDIFNWFLKTMPKSVTAFGGLEQSKQEAIKRKVGYIPETMDHTLAIYQWDTTYGPVRGFYQVDLRTSRGGFYEEFMGDKGNMVISEIATKNAFFFEPSAEKLADWAAEAKEKDEDDAEAGFAFKLGPSGDEKDDSKKLKLDADLPIHFWHLENFFDAIRDSGVKLTCPGEDAFQTCVAVIKANESAETGKTVYFKPQDFIA